MGSDPPKPKEPEKTLKGTCQLTQNRSKNTPLRSIRCVD